jgi:hypothetical protein
VIPPRRSLIALNGLIRLGYGVGGLLTPAAMASARLVPDTDDRPEARLFVRGFSGHQIGVAAVGLASLASRRHERTAMTLALAIDALDLVTVAVERRARGRLDEDLAGGIAVSAAGAVSAGAALLARG